MIETPGEVDATKPRAHARPDRLFRALAATCLFAMMTLTFVTVVARYFLNRPIAGDYELQAFLLGLVIFSAVPLVTRAQRHIAVRVLATVLKGRARLLQHAIVLGITAAGFAAIAYLIFLQGETLGDDDIRTSYLGIPEAPFAYFFAALVLAAGLMSCELLYRLLRNRGAAAETDRPETSVE